MIGPRLSSRCHEKFVAPGKFFPPSYSHNVTNRNPNPNPDLNPTLNPQPNPNFNPIPNLNPNPNPYWCMWELFFDVTNFPLHQYWPAISKIHYSGSLLRYTPLSSMAPPYLDANCQLVSCENRRQLHSANSMTCAIKRTCSSYGNKCFAAAGPRLWNSLPAHLRQTDINFEQFKWQLKTFLFGHW